MGEMTTTETAEVTGRPILEFGRAWMLAPGTRAKAEELGLTGTGLFGFWVNGRAGVLGDVDPSVAAAAIGFMAPEAVAMHWAGRGPHLSPWNAAVAWFGCAAEWGRENLGEIQEARLRRLADLARIVIDGADRSLGSLFAGSALIPLPGDAAGDAVINLNVLRELRGGAHLSACHAAGLGPHATIMSTDDPVRGGASWAETFGWAPPHPAGDADARAEIEAMTTRAVAPIFGALSGAERAEFAELVVEARGVLAE